MDFQRAAQSRCCESFFDRNSGWALLVLQFRQGAHHSLSNSMILWFWLSPLTAPVSMSEELLVFFWVKPSWRRHSANTQSATTPTSRAHKEHNFLVQVSSKAKARWDKHLPVHLTTAAPLKPAPSLQYEVEHTPKDTLLMGCIQTCDQGRFKLNAQKNFFSGRVMRHCNPVVRLPREVVGSPGVVQGKSKCGTEGYS